MENIPNPWGRRRLAGQNSRTVVPEPNTPPARRRRSQGWTATLALLFLTLLLSGCCSTAQREKVSARPFDFQRDTFSFTNGLIWVYEYDANGKWTTHTRTPRPDYWQHCFVLARAAKQFFINARFDGELPRVDNETYRKLVKKVMHTSARDYLPEDSKIVIPGYSGLRQFSEAHTQLLKDNCGSAWQSYFQRGHWHVVIPFTRSSQERTATELLRELAQNDAPVVHLIIFPQLTINHAVIIFNAKEDPGSIAFSIYDPNQPSAPRTIFYDKASRTFSFPANDYFPGGKLDVYEIYKGWLY